MAQPAKYERINYKMPVQCPVHNCLCKVTDTTPRMRYLKCPLCEFKTKQLRCDETKQKPQPSL